MSGFESYHSRKKQRNLKLHTFLKQRLWVGVKAACSVLIYPCDAEQRTAMGNKYRVKGEEI
jgi:hypothetical protein